MKVSVLLPCRDAARFLDDALASLFHQTFSNFEIIAVDDGSTDDTSEILGAAALRDSRLRVVRTSARGLVPALTTAIDHARAPLLARMDADDLAHPDRLAAQVELLRNRPEIAACGTNVRYFPRRSVRDGALRYEAWINELIEWQDIERDAFVECPIAHPTLMVRAEALRSAGGYRDNGWPEDYDLVLRLLRAGNRLANVPRTLHEWRERPDRLSRTDGRYSEESFRRCKAYHLGPARIQDRDVVVWGSGPVGKLFARELEACGGSVVAFIDVDPRKIGQRVGTIPIVAPDDIPRYRAAYFLAAVGNAQARVQIRAALLAVGLKEIADFCAVA